MKKKNMTAIWSALKQAGFSNKGYAENYWVKPGDIMFVFRHGPAGYAGHDLFCRMSVCVRTDRDEMLLGEEDFYLTDIIVSKLDPDWLVAHMKELAKKAYDVLVVKAKAAAEIAMIGA